MAKSKKINKRKMSDEEFGELFFSGMCLWCLKRQRTSELLCGPCKVIHTQRINGIKIKHSEGLFTSDLGEQDVPLVELEAIYDVLLSVCPDEPQLGKKEDIIKKKRG